MVSRININPTQNLFSLVNLSKPLFTMKQKESHGSPVLVGRHPTLPKRDDEQPARVVLLVASYLHDFKYQHQTNPKLSFVSL